MDNIRIIFNRIANEYKHLKADYKNYLFETYNIECGTNYARYILEEIVYNENGESIY